MPIVQRFLDRLGLDRAARARELLRRLGPAGLMALIATGLPVVGGLVIIGTVMHLAPWLRSHGALGLIIYICGFWMLGGLALLPTYSHSALGGWAFGFRPGLAAALVSLAGAAVVSYAITRRASGNRVTDAVAENPKWQAVYNVLLAGGFWRTFFIITLLRIPPAPPFAASNVLLASARAPILPFILGTLVGLMPRTAWVVYTAQGLQRLTGEESGQSWWPFLISLAVTAVVVAIIVALARHAINRVTRPNQA